MIIVTSSFSKTVFQPFFKPAFSTFPGLKSVLEKLRFSDRLVWTVGLTVEIKFLKVSKFGRCSDDRGPSL